MDVSIQRVRIAVRATTGPSEKPTQAQILEIAHMTHTDNARREIQEMLLRRLVTFTDIYKPLEIYHTLILIQKCLLLSSPDFVHFCTNLVHNALSLTRYVYNVPDTPRDTETGILIEQVMLVREAANTLSKLLLDPAQLAERRSIMSVETPSALVPPSPVSAAVSLPSPPESPEAPMSSLPPGYRAVDTPARNRSISKAVEPSLPTSNWSTLGQAGRSTPPSPAMKQSTAGNARLPPENTDTLKTKGILKNLKRHRPSNTGESALFEPTPAPRGKDETRDPTTLASFEGISPTKTPRVAPKTRQKPVKDTSQTPLAETSQEALIRMLAGFTHDQGNPSTNLPYTHEAPRSKPKIIKTNPAPPVESSVRMAVSQIPTAAIYIPQEPNSRTKAPPKKISIEPKGSNKSSSPVREPVLDVSEYVAKLGSHPVAGGGFSDVWMGVYKTPEVKSLIVAIKLLRRLSKFPPERIRKRCNRELHAWCGLHHPNITPLYGIFIDEHGDVGMVSPYYSKGDIVGYMQENEVDPLKMIQEIADGVEYLHDQKIVHGDIKGANIMIDDAGRPKLIDFGLSQVIDEFVEETGNTTSTIAFSLRWSAPELLIGEDSSKTEKSDIYALASTFVEIMTLKPPYKGLKDPQVMNHVIRRGIPDRPVSVEENWSPCDELWELLVACWKTNRKERPDIWTVRSKLGEYTGLSPSVVGTSAASASNRPTWTQWRPS